MWEADQCQVRISLKNEDGKAQMPLLSGIEEDYSVCITGYRLSWSGPSARLTLKGAIEVKAGGVDGGIAGERG